VKAEDLYALMLPHGIDGAAAARVAPKKKARADVRMVVRDGKSYAVLLRPSESRARGKSSPSFVKPSYTMAELAMAAAGCPEREFMAAGLSFAGSQANYWRLHAELTREANRLRRQHDWPETVIDVHQLQRPYVEHISKMVLDEDLFASVFRVPDLYWIYQGVTERVWRRELSGRFMAVKFIWMQWLGTAAEIVQSKLGESKT
jgi:hypothetical protein